MKTNPRNISGTVVTLAWLGAGVYTVFWGANPTWKGIGFLIIAVGVVRGALLLRQWNKT